jgi:hypothetical protein
MEYFMPCISDLRLLKSSLIPSFRFLANRFNGSMHSPIGCWLLQYGQHPIRGTLITANFLAPKLYNVCRAMQSAVVKNCQRFQSLGLMF